MSIEAQGVTKIFGQQRALDHVNLSVGKGQVVGFLGPNGAGKSTMMRIITCYLPATEGKVAVCGFDTSTQSLEVRRKVGYLPEANPLYPDMYVREYLQYVARLYRLKDGAQRAERMIELTGLTPERTKLIGQLSKGYRQRVGLAQAMIHEPEVLILDEPTSGLDPNQLVGIRALIKELGRDRTVLFSSHIMQEVEAVADRVVIINRGKIVADSPTAEVGHLVAQVAVVVEFDRQPDVRALSKALPKCKIEQTGERTLSVKSAQGFDARPEVAKWAQSNNLLVLGMSIGETSLEEVFQQLTTAKK